MFCFESGENDVIDLLNILQISSSSSSCMDYGCVYNVHCTRSHGWNTWCYDIKTTKCEESLWAAHCEMANQYQRIQQMYRPCVIILNATSSSYDIGRMSQ